jgi:hypothetical protein
VCVAHSSYSLGWRNVEELEALEQQIARAWVDGDRVLLDSISTDDWTSIDITDHVRTKADVFGDMFAPGAPEIKDVMIDDMRARMLGNVGVVTGRTRWRGADGTAITLRFSDVAVRQNGGWQIVSSQGTRIVERVAIGRARILLVSCVRRSAERSPNSSLQRTSDDLLC